LSHEGRGVAHRDGKVCFVDGALAGESVAARLIARHARHDEYAVVDVETPAPERVVPPCRLVGRCGGCDLQHLDPRAQVAHKTMTVLDVLRRQAKLEPAAVDAPITSAPFHYRRRARLAIDTPRRHGRPVLGFREARGKEVVEIDRCDVLAEPLAQLPEALNAVLRDLEEPRRLGHIEIALSESGERSLPVVGLRIVGALGEHDSARWQRFAEHHDTYLCFDDGESVREIRAASSEPIGYELPEFELRLEFAPGDFLQGKSLVNRELVRRLTDVLGDVTGLSVLDAFAGLGNFSLPLARRGARVLGVEGESGMVARASQNAARHDLGSAEFVVRDLGAAPADLPRDRFDVVVLDPPRAGALALVRQLAALAVPKILYVSCMPTSLARDARVLADAGYAIERLALVDMFPQTSHIEAMAVFSRRARRRRR